MMSMIRWDPRGEAMDSLLQESVVRPRPGGGGANAVALALDVEERGYSFVVTTPVPGINPENIELSVLDDTVRIQAERQDERREEGENRRWLLA